MKMKRISGFIWLILLMIWNVKSSAQFTNGLSSPVALTKAIPASPDAAALGRYGDVPVSYYTGIPSISIPFYEIKSKNLSVPISLSYYAGGLKVEEVASSVGLGWSLNAGGVITRTIRGKADDDGGFGFINGFKIITKLNTTTDEAVKADILNKIANGTYDAESDLYYYNFCGYSGKFVMDENGICYTIPQQKIKIEYEKFGPSSNIYTWVLTTPDGVKYSFGSYMGSSPDLRDVNKSRNSCNSSGVYEMNTTGWYLSKMQGTNPFNLINFYYETTHFTYETKQTEVKYQFDHVENLSLDYILSNGGNVDPPVTTNCSNNNEFFSVRLSHIDFDNGQVFFYTDPATRVDIPGAPVINKIVIQNNLNFKKQYRLLYNYFGIGTSSRLKLNEIDEVTDDLSYNDDQHFITLNKYGFEYNSLSLPIRTSYSQDAWGFYNGASNTTLVPQQIFLISGISDEPEHYTILQGGDRTPDETNMQAAILTKITYPTGGTSKFYYEANREGNLVSPYAPKIYQAAAYNDDNFGYFDIVSNDAKVIVNATATGIEDISDPNNTPTIKGLICRVDANDNVIYPAFATIYNGSSVFVLPPARYRLFEDNPKHATSFHTIQISWKNDDISKNTNLITGGLRIKKIETTDPTSGVLNTRNFRYDLNDNPNTSSGVLMGLPVFSYYWGTESSVSIDQIPQTLIFKFNKVFLTRSSNTNYPLAVTQGAVVGYSRVVEENGNGAINGKTEKFYTNPLQFTDVQHNEFPFAPAESYDWRRGNLLNEISYKKNQDGTFSKVSEKINTYFNTTPNGPFGAKVSYNPQPCDCGIVVINGTFTQTYIKRTDYLTPYEWWYLKTETSKIYNSDGSGSFSQTQSSYDYDASSYLPSAVTTTNSKNQQVVTHMTYPGTYDFFAFNDDATGIDLLVKKNVLIPVIEKYTQIKDPNSTAFKTVAGTITTYKKDNPVPNAIFQLQTSTPLTTFQPTTNSSSFFPDPAYKQVLAFKNYDADANLLDQAKTNDVNVGYIWDYSNSLPIAEVVNAENSQIAYTSFESDGKGGWNYSGNSTANEFCPTGKKIYNLWQPNANITRSVSASQIYIVSYWTNNTNSVKVTGTVSGYPLKGKTIKGWTYFEHKITGLNSVTISGVGAIDELRLYPDGAQMTTYSFEPFVGMISQCDANNKVKYYEYDRAGRLRIIRDQDNNVLKKICYNFAGQQVDCGNFYNQAQTKTFIKSDCSGNQGGSEVPYTVAQGKYSSTNSQAAADQLATNEITANGPNNANSNGSCLPKTNILSSNWDMRSGFIVTYTNVFDNTQVYSFTSIPSPNPFQVSTLSPSVPQGTYNITFSYAPGNPGLTQYTIGPGTNALIKLVATATTTFNNVVVTATTCNQIGIGYPISNN